MDDLVSRNRSQLDRSHGDRLNRLIQEQRKQAAKKQKAWVTGHENGFYQAATPGNGSLPKRIATNGAVGTGDPVRNRGGMIDAKPTVRSKAQESSTSSKKHLLKYLYSTRDNAGIITIRAAGWQKNAVLVKEIPAGWSIGHASIDNLGTDAFSVNLSYRSPDMENQMYTIEKLVYDATQGECKVEWSRVEKNPIGYGHGFWISSADMGEGYGSANDSYTDLSEDNSYQVGAPPDDPNFYYVQRAYERSDNTITGYIRTAGASREYSYNHSNKYSQGYEIKFPTASYNPNVDVRIIDFVNEYTYVYDYIDPETVTQVKLIRDKDYKFLPSMTYLGEEHRQGYGGDTGYYMSRISYLAIYTTPPNYIETTYKKQDSTYTVILSWLCTEKISSGSVSTIYSDFYNPPAIYESSNYATGNGYSLIKVGPEGLSSIGQVTRNDISTKPNRNFFCNYNESHGSYWRDFEYDFRPDSTNDKLVQFSPAKQKFWLDVFRNGFSYIFQIESETDPNKVTYSLFRKYVAPFTPSKNTDNDPPNPPSTTFKVKVRDVTAPTIDDVFGFPIPNSKVTELETYVYRVADSDLNFDAKGNPTQFQVYNASYYPR